MYICKDTNTKRTTDPITASHVGALNNIHNTYNILNCNIHIDMAKMKSALSKFFYQNLSERASVLLLYEMTVFIN